MTQDHHFIGWDIGGAHLKMAHVDDTGRIVRVCQLATPLWKGIDILSTALTQADKYLPDNNLVHAVTTTAELVDIFRDRMTGIEAIKLLLTEQLTGNDILFYAGDAGLVPAMETGKYTDMIASANWHATASFLSQQLEEGILLDIGSTTTDIIPFKAGKLCHSGHSDFDRLRVAELVYTGVIRTPIMAIVDQVPYQGKWQPVAAELFATIADVYRLTGEISVDDDLQETADGRGKTQLESARRLARMLGADIGDDNALEPWRQTAGFIADKQLQQIQDALSRVKLQVGISGKAIITGAGTGSFLAEKIATNLKMKYADFSDMLIMKENHPVTAGQCATAVSVAMILRSKIQA